MVEDETDVLAAKELKAEVIADNAITINYLN
jgi:hypothetical protein